MAAIEAVTALSFLRHPSSSPKTFLSPKPQSLSSLTFQISISTPLFSQNFPIHPLINTQKNLGFKLCSTLQELSVEAETEKTQKPNVKRKLFVLNLPRAYTVADIKDLFSQCGNVKDVEIIKEKDGKSRGFSFVTMASGEEAQAAVDKLDSHEVSGRIIRVEFARRFKRPSPATSQPIVPSCESRHKLYVSNLNWKVRANHLREFFSAFNPVSARVIFGTPSGQSAGYGFVSFATKEEAEAAISTLDGKELMDRPLRLKFSEKTANEFGDEDTEQKEIEVLDIHLDLMSPSF
ncbi:ubiquitin carboxyl-terminal hydrolase 21-like isoform X1 [Hibiscus syriacus]|uniref:Ubiquitin carboxyl-terminal hydrolase 21-like isoform X1 n=1 Tax=Hibiscus syriacus TaxID=106335 RepID=A0A6A3CC13_HIBSY|nr:28 kDa ribonucleoprotein, chloroplastic-like [Hibiscus syriacus]KAE8726835.1 ubiquitin carboxyl-terminal hydrolase 21-like isoform X1 [Hibiscus syriacus]